MWFGGSDVPVFVALISAASSDELWREDYYDATTFADFSIADMSVFLFYCFCYFRWFMYVSLGVISLCFIIFHLYDFFVFTYIYVCLWACFIFVWCLFFGGIYIAMFAALTSDADFASVTYLSFRYFLCVCWLLITLMCIFGSYFADLLYIFFSVFYYFSVFLWVWFCFFHFLLRGFMGVRLPCFIFLHLMLIFLCHSGWVLFMLLFLLL